MSVCGVSVILPLIVSAAPKASDGNTVSMLVSPSPAVRCCGSSATLTLSRPTTTVKSPRVSMSRPPRSIVRLADHRASTSDEPGAHDSTVNDEEPPVNSLPLTGSSAFVTLTQPSVSFSLPASEPT